MTDVYLHIGLPKTGTTTIQAALARRADLLARAGVLYPGGRQAQRLAAFDLVGQRVGGDERRVTGALDRLCTEVRAFDGRAVVISEEELGLARPRQIRTLLRGLGARRTFVVLTVRDVARTVVSAWQQTVVMGRTTAWRDYVGAVREAERGPISIGAGFRLRHDLIPIIDRWADEVPLERIRVVTLPPRGADPRVLLVRFAEAADLSPAIWDRITVDEHNVSLGAAELEVLRRLNQSVEGSLTPREHRLLVDAGIKPGLAACRRPLVLPVDHRPWAEEYADLLVAELARREVRVYGDLTDLVPRAPDTGGQAPDDVGADELFHATERVLGSLAGAYAHLSVAQRRSHRGGRGPAPPPAGLAPTLAGLSRRTAFRAKKLVQAHADDHPVLARVVRR